MTLPAFAQHLAGRMLPGWFSSLIRRPRFPGDPWPDQFAPGWYWMHAEGCARGGGNGSSDWRRYEPHWREVLAKPAICQPSANGLQPPAQGELFTAPPNGCASPAKSNR